MDNIEIYGTNLRIKEFAGQRVVTLADIDALHHRAPGTAARNFSENRQRFKEKKDFFIAVITGDSFREKYGLHPKARNTVTFITESGYFLLVKTLKDDLAWKVQEKLRNVYFNHRALVEAVAEAKVDHSFTELLEQQNKLLAEQNSIMQNFCSVMLESFQILSRAAINSQSIVQQPVAKAIIEETETKPTDFQNIDFAYKKELRRYLNQILSTHGGFSSTGEVLTYLCKNATRKYGICWEQEAKEYHRQTGKTGKFLDIIAAAPEARQYKSIVLSMARDMATNLQSENRTEPEEIGEIAYVSSVGDVSRALEEICLKINSHSPHGAAVINKLQSVCARKYGYDFKQMKQEYKESHNFPTNARVSMVMLLGEHENLKNDFINELNSYIESINGM